MFFFSFSTIPNLHFDSYSHLCILLRNISYTFKYSIKEKALFKTPRSWSAEAVCTDGLCSSEFWVVPLTSPGFCWTSHGCQVKTPLTEASMPPGPHPILEFWVPRLRKGIWKEKPQFAFTWGYRAVIETSLRSTFPIHQSGKTPSLCQTFKWKCYHS